MLNLKGKGLTCLILPSTPRRLCLLPRHLTHNRSWQTCRSLSAPGAPDQKYPSPSQPFINHLQHHAVICKAPVPRSIRRPWCKINLLARVPVLPHSLLLLVRVRCPHPKLPAGWLRHLFQARADLLVLPGKRPSIWLLMKSRLFTWKRGSQRSIQTSAYSSSGQPDPRVWHRCGVPCPSREE